MTGQLYLYSFIMLHRICHASLTIGLSCRCCCHGRRATPAAAKVGRDQGRADRRLARQALPQPDLPPGYRRRDADRGDAGGGFAHVRQRAHRLVSGKGQGCFCVGANWLLFPPFCSSVFVPSPKHEGGTQILVTVDGKHRHSSHLCRPLPPQVDKQEGDTQVLVGKHRHPSHLCRPPYPLR